MSRGPHLPGTPAHSKKSLKVRIPYQFSDQKVPQRASIAPLETSNSVQAGFHTGANNSSLEPFQELGVTQ